MNQQPHDGTHRFDEHPPRGAGTSPAGWQQPPPYAYGRPPTPATQPPGRRYETFGMLALAAFTVAVAVITAFGALALHERDAASSQQSQSVAPVQRVDNTSDGSNSTTLQRAAQSVVPGMVYINTELGYQDSAGAGTGIVLTSSGEVLTNNHVISGATSISATDLATGRTYPAAVVGYDRKADVAVVKLTGASGMTPAPLGDSSTVKVGDAIVGVGNAGGAGGNPTASPGRVTGLGQSITASDESSGSAEQLTGLIQIAANIQPGDSGGPLVNSAGKVVGMNTAASAGFRLGGQNTGGGEGFAIPIATARSVAGQITSGSRSASVHIGDSAMLGVTASDAPDRSGAVVAQVLVDGAAAQVLSGGDTITALNGTPIASVTALTDTVDTLYPGETVPITWVDQSGQQQSAPITLAGGAAG